MGNEYIQTCSSTVVVNYSDNRYYCRQNIFITEQKKRDSSAQSTP